MINRSEYKYVGENYRYSGRIYWKPQGGEKELIVGEWNNGEIQFVDNYKEIVEKNGKIQSEVEDRKPAVGGLSQQRIQKLYEDYMDILKCEVDVYGIKPTEVRHLIGRIGEFKCALETKGSLAHKVNQHGFDVTADNRHISVKTTAQKTGFVSINKNTLDKVDDLMVLQYEKREFKIIYYGSIEKAVASARTFNGKYELDISKAKRLKRQKRKQEDKGI